MKQKILDFFKLRDEIESVVKQYVQDKSIPLNERWEIFEQSGFGEHQCWIKHLDSLHDDIVMYDGLVHADRMQSISVFTIIERYEDDMEDLDDEEKNDPDENKWLKYKFDPITFKEECLAKFIKGWDYDW